MQQQNRRTSMKSDSEDVTGVSKLKRHRLVLSLLFLSQAITIEESLMILLPMLTPLA